MGVDRDPLSPRAVALVRLPPHVNTSRRSEALLVSIENAQPSAFFQLVQETTKPDAIYFDWSTWAQSERSAPARMRRLARTCAALQVRSQSCPKSASRPSRSICAACAAHIHKNRVRRATIAGVRLPRRCRRFSFTSRSRKSNDSSGDRRGGVCRGDRDRPSPRTGRFGAGARQSLPGLDRQYRRLRAKPDKKIVDDQAAMPSS